LFGEPFSRMWMHNGMVNSNKEKMSKSLGNFFMLRQLYEHFDPMVIRYYFLTHHYRMPIEFSFEGLASAQKSYERLIRLCSGGSENVNLNNYRSDLSDHVSSIALATDQALAKSDIVTRMLDFLQDDLNTPGLLGVLFEHIAEIAQNAQELAAVKTILENILGLTLQPLPERTIHMTPEIELLIAERNKARHEKNWKRADELRDQLKAMGMEVQDAKL
jgi:cysteinyl-tRNA synthetase